MVFSNTIIIMIINEDTNFEIHFTIFMILINLHLTKILYILFWIMDGIAFIYMHVPDPLFIILFQFLYMLVNVN